MSKLHFTNEESSQGCHIWFITKREKILFENTILFLDKIAAIFVLCYLTTLSALNLEQVFPNTFSLMSSWIVPKYMLNENLPLWEANEGQMWP
jgi:hypothetical protein